MIKKIKIRNYFSFLFWYHGTLDVFEYFVKCAVDFPIYLKALNDSSNVTFDNVTRSLFESIMIGTSFNDMISCEYANEGNSRVGEKLICAYCVKFCCNGHILFLLFERINGE